ncbi:MAG: M12 family metallo-peptidase [Planctomycetota bacterium]
MNRSRTTVRSLGTIALLVPVLVAALAAGLRAATLDAALHDFVAESLNVTDFEVISLDLPPDGIRQFETTVVITGVPHTLTLERRSLRTPDFTLLVQGAEGALEPVLPPPPCTYRGFVQGLPQSRVAATLAGGELKALIELRPHDTVVIEPLSTVLARISPVLHLLYHGDQVRAPAGRCGVESPALAGGPGYTPESTGLQVCDLAIDADYEFFRRHKSDVDQTLLGIETILNGVELIYERDTQITYELSVIVVRTSEPDPYDSTDPGTLLGQFQALWNGALRPLRRDTAHLMTGKELDGNIIGLAWVGVVCVRDYGYGLSQYLRNLYSDVGLVAHEVGHNWNAGHCDGDSDCYIMCSGLGGCGGDLSRFGSRSIASITSFRDSRGCVAPLPDPLALPFSELFPSTSIDPLKWSYVEGPFINMLAQGEPSPPYSLDLDAASADPYRDDDIRSNFIQLAGVEHARLSYATEHRGPEAGETLVVEGWTDGLRWVELNRVISDGSVQDEFVRHAHVLPAECYHDKFCMRFRSEVDGYGDEWFVDDILLEAVTCPLPELYGEPTPGTAGITPEISYDGGVPGLGSSSYKLTAARLYGGMTGFLFTGFSRVTVNMGGVNFNVLPPWYVLTFTVAGPALPGFGSAEILVPIPSDPTLAGLHFMNFFLCIDPGGPRGLTGTQGLDSTICG